MTPVAGAYPIQGVGKLPNAQVAYPGEVWTNRRANGIIVPGSCVRPVNVGGRKAYRTVADGEVAGTDFDKAALAVALRPIAIPDVNNGSIYGQPLGPNEIVNLLIADGDYVRTYHSGGLHLTLVEPVVGGYAPADQIGWSATAARPAGKAAGTGAWTNTGYETGTNIFEVEEVRPYGPSANHEVLLTVRFLRSNN
jgi:hypothetical protein